MSHFEEFIRQGSSKGMPRAMEAFYQSIANLIPEEEAFLADYIQLAVNYPAAIFVTGTDAQYMAVAPWDGEITQLAIVNQRTITGGPAAVAFKINGGSAIATLGTGAGTIGLVDSDLPATPYEIDQGEVLTAESDGNATGTSEIMVFATLRSRSS